MKSPAVLWYEADKEIRDKYGDAPLPLPSFIEERSKRYNELMREHGHIVKKDHPDAGGDTLPCGWHPSRGDEGCE